MLSFEPGYQVVGETQVMERLCQDRSGVLRLAAITLQPLLRCAAVTLPGFQMFFDVSGRVPPACG